MDIFTKIGLLLEDSGEVDEGSDRRGIAGPSPSPEALRLASLFDTDEKMGATYDEEEGCSYLPGNLSYGICTHSAAYVLHTLGKGEIWGSSEDDNPGEAVKLVGGHDWAVIDRRYIVDPWLHTFTGESDQLVFDLKNPADKEAILHWYGPPSTWERMNCDALGYYMGRLGRTTDFPIKGKDGEPFE